MPDNGEPKPTRHSTYSTSRSYIAPIINTHAAGFNRRAHSAELIKSHPKGMSVYGGGVGYRPPVLYGIRFADVRVFRENRCKPIRILCQPSRSYPGRS